MAERVEMDESRHSEGAEFSGVYQPSRGSRSSRSKKRSAQRRSGSSTGSKLEARSGHTSAAIGGISRVTVDSRSPRFPAKLHDMLSQTDLSHAIIEWSQDGTCFRILDRDRLAVELLPIYFVSA